MHQFPKLEKHLKESAFYMPHSSASEKDGSDHTGYQVSSSASLGDTSLKEGCIGSGGGFCASIWADAAALYQE